MPYLKSNILRIQLSSSAHQYEVKILNKQEEIDYNQLQDLLQNLLPNVVLDFPYVYTTIQLLKTEYTLLQSNGQAFELKLHKKPIFIQTHQILPAIANKLLRSLNFINCKQLQISFNPFDQEMLDDKYSQMPGLSLVPINIPNTFGFFIVPKYLWINHKGDLTSDSDWLIDYKTGIFYQKSKVVRIDIKTSMILFRNGKTINRESIRPCRIQQMNGYTLCYYATNYMNRIRQNIMIKQWDIRIDNRFMQILYNTINPGIIIFRNEIQKSLGDIVNSISKYNFQYQYKTLFNSINLYDIIKCQIIFLVAIHLEHFIHLIQKEILKRNNSMALQILCKIILYNSINQFQNIIDKINRQFFDSKTIIIMLVPSDKNKQQIYSLNHIIQNFINKSIYFHIEDIQDKEDSEFIAIKLVTILYAKLRLNPWKIQNIPFGTQPIMALAIDLILHPDNTLSVAIVASLNSFLNKFTAAIDSTSQETLESKMMLLICDIMDKFKSIHNIYPVRVFAFRTGYTNTHNKEFPTLKNAFINNYKSTLTYIQLLNTHPLRTFNQIDANFVSGQNVKKMQCLSILEFNNEIYVQLEAEEPMYKIKVHEPEKDPTFLEKVHLLTAKLVYGSVGNRYGKGLGFLDFAKKLNSFSHLDLAPWKEPLKSGILVFL